MARKNLIGISDDPIDADAERAAADRPIAGLNPAPRPAAAVGGITRSLSNITQKVERAQELERQLAEGLAVVELDPAHVDASFVADRLGVAAHEQQSLAAQIREHGQQVPILVRPHPTAEGRYQVAYGHRRLAAAREIGGKVRAVVRELNDEQLVVSQGQENNARADLSFIERALFATRLEDRGFSREIIMAALGVDKAALSKMVSVVRRLPIVAIEAIGPAPSIGRRRWFELAELLSPDEKAEAASAFMQGQEFQEASSDQRFDALCTFLSTSRARAKAIPWVAPDETSPIRIRETESGTTLTFSRKSAPGFADFVRQRLKSLYLEYQEETGD
ncbi:MAG TPA: plasmid partitioning protein RepB [Ensifer sp.]|jgi:ParB family chromosome partitioning protein|uniref:plasmid partitioning protein RepB n=1 Tax=Ensifer sp. TaxID=1872086 RepID=UPI002E0E69AD|nr:plasmid partitioning protein RepB [Ensifer sp.]